MTPADRAQACVARSLRSLVCLWRNNYDLYDVPQALCERAVDFY